MSTDYFVYLGPVAICAVERVPEQVKGCTYSGCRSFHKKIYDNPSFCSNCGNPIGTFEVPNTREKVNSWQLFKGDDPLTSELDSKETHRLFVPNHSRNSPERDRNHDLHDQWEEVLTPETIVTELAWFERAYANEIAELRAAYDADKVKVAWMQFSGTR